LTSFSICAKFGENLINELLAKVCNLPFDRLRVNGLRFKLFRVNGLRLKLFSFSVRGELVESQKNTFARASNGNKYLNHIRR
jgi:hypothetical protein